MSKRRHIDVVPTSIGNESVPKSMINNTINLFFKPAIGILIISNDNSFRVLFDEIASVKNVLFLYFSIGIGQPRDPALCQMYRHTFVPYGMT